MKLEVIMTEMLFSMFDGALGVRCAMGGRRGTVSVVCDEGSQLPTQQDAVVCRPAAGR